MSVTITLANDLPAEAETREQLRDMLARYDLRTWQCTDHVRIEEGAIPHSHPVLTLNTREPSDELLLATYLHEQIHWFTLVEANREAGRCADREWRRMYPDVPVALPEGCGSEFSNYLHFTVCFFEYAGLIALLGEAAARDVMEHRAARFYRYVYRAVLRDFPEMHAVMVRCGLTL